MAPAAAGPLALSADVGAPSEHVALVEELVALSSNPSVDRLTFDTLAQPPSGGDALRGILVG